VRAAERRWLGLLPNEASEQVRRVASRFAVLEAALLLSFTHRMGYRECRDALQHSFNAWVNEFGMGTVRPKRGLNRLKHSAAVWVQSVPALSQYRSA
jgi:putative DNA primase/helicase